MGGLGGGGVATKEWVTTESYRTAEPLQHSPIGVVDGEDVRRDPLVLLAIVELDHPRVVRGDGGGQFTTKGGITIESYKPGGPCSIAP